MAFADSTQPYPCTVNIDATLFFPSGSGMPVSENMKATNMFIDGFCPRDAGAD